MAHQFPLEIRQNMFCKILESLFIHVVNAVSGKILKDLKQLSISYTASYSSQAKEDFISVLLLPEVVVRLPDIYFL